MHSLLLYTHIVRYLFNLKDGLNSYPKNLTIDYQLSTMNRSRAGRSHYNYQSIDYQLSTINYQLSTIQTLVAEGKLVGREKSTDSPECAAPFGLLEAGSCW
ncbi:MAG: hypothetical protein ACRC62_24215 [Microcoleus sp.]